MEFIGDEIIGLCSKTYFVENGELQISKLSCKEANKNALRTQKRNSKKFYNKSAPKCVKTSASIRNVTQCLPTDRQKCLHLFLRET